MVLWRPCGGALGGLVLWALFLGMWSQKEVIADSNPSSEERSVQNDLRPSEHGTATGNHKDSPPETPNNEPVFNIDTLEEFYKIMGNENLNGGSAADVHPRMTKNRDREPASDTQENPSSPGDNIMQGTESTEHTADYTMESDQPTSDVYVMSGDAMVTGSPVHEDVMIGGHPAANKGPHSKGGDSMGNGPPTYTMGSEYSEEEKVMDTDQPTADAMDSDHPTANNTMDDYVPVDPIYTDNLPTYDDIEDFYTYDVDESDIPLVYEKKDDFSTENMDDLGPAEGDDYLRLNELTSKLSNFDLEEQLSKMGIGKGDLLNGLSTEKLNRLLGLWMAWLKEELSAMYRSELKRSDVVWDNITDAAEGDRDYGGTGRSAVAPYAGNTPVLYGKEETVGAPTPEEFWQPYIYDTGIANRKAIKIEGVSVEGTLQGTSVAKIIPVNLPGMSVLYVSHKGFGYVEMNGKLERLVVLNEWTLSSSGCQCGQDVTSKGCACCVAGACLCQGAFDICVACGTEYTSCQGGELSGVYVSAATGTIISSQDGSVHLSVLAVAYSTSINIFSHISSGGSLKWLGSMNLQQEVTHLAFGTTFTDHDEATIENTFLVIFNSGATDHQFNEIIVSSMAPAFTVGPPVKWQAKGESMGIHQGDGHVLVTVHGSRYIDTFTLQEDKWMKRHMIHEYTFKGAFNTWLAFQVHFDTYVALTARRHIVFYRWNRMEGEFEQLNTIYMDDSMPSIEGLVAVNVESCREEVSVVVAGHGRSVAVFVLQYNFTTSTHSFVMEFQGSLQASLDWSIAAHHLRGTSRLVALEAGKGEVAIIKVKASAADVDHPMGSERDVLDNTMEYIKNENARQQSIIAAAEARLAHSVLFSNTVLADVTITGSITIAGEFSTGGLSAERLVFPGTDLAHGVTHLEYLQHLSSARPGLDLSKRLLQDIQVIENSLAFAVPASGPNRTIEGLKTIVAGNRLVLNSVVIEHMSVGELLDANGARFPLNSTLSSIIRMDQTDRRIRGRKTFASRLSVQHLHTTFLDDIPTSDLVTASGQHSIAGAVFARGLWAQEVKLRAGGTLAGVDLTRVVLLGHSAVLGKVTIAAHEFVARSVDVLSGVVGGVDLARLYNHTLLVTGGQFAGSLLFTTDVTVENLVAGVMMGVDVRRLAESVVYRDEDAVLTGSLHFMQTVTVEGQMITKTINGRRFPEDFAVKVGSSDLTFTNDVTFDHVVFGEVAFGASAVVDGIAPHRFMTKTTDQVVEGRKVFTVGVDINGHLDISSKLLDDVNLDDLFSRDRRPSSLPADWKFNLVCKGDVWLHRIFTQGTVNGGDLSALARDLIYKGEDQVKISGRKVFLNGLTISNAVFQGGFNGLDLASLVTTDTDVVISGVFTFTSDLFFHSLVAGRVSGIDLNALINSALHLKKAGQVVTGRKVFLKPVVVGSLVIEGSLKGVDFSNFVTKSGNQTFTAPQIFKSANFAFLHAQSIQMAQDLKINGVDLSELARRRMPLREPVSHTGTLTIEGPLEITGAASIEILNGANLDDLLSTIVTDEGDFTIDGQVSLSSLRVLGAVTTEGGVGANGVSLRNLAKNAIRLSANNQIQGHLSFSRVEVRGELGVDGLVEGVHLERLHQDAVYSDVQTLQTITGAKMFDEGFTVRGNIHTRTTNGVDLSRSLFTRTTDQVIRAPVTFHSVSALQNVFLQGHFNEFDLKTLAQQSIMRGKKEDIVMAELTFTGRVSVKNLVLRGMLHGSHGSIDIRAHLADAVRLQDTAITITGKKIFTAGLSFGNLHVEILDGRKLDHFLALVVTRNRPHTLTGAVQVRGTIIAPWVTAQQLIVKGTIDTVDLQALRKVVVFLNGQQSVDASLVFREAVLVRGNLQTVLLNDVALNEGYLTTSTPQTFNLNVTLSSVLASHVEVHGLVNSWNLLQEINRTLMALDGQSMPGSLTLSGQVVVKGDIVVTGRVGRGRMVKLSQQVVLLDRRTQISGTLSFTVPLTVAWVKSTTGIVNGVDISQLYKSAWFVDTTTQLTTSVSFMGSVVVKRGFFSQGTIDGLDVERAYSIARAARDGFRNITVQFETEFERICRPIARLYNKLEACMYEGDHLAFHGSLPLPAAPRESISFYAFGTTVLLVSYMGSCHLDFLTWQDDNFVMSQRVQHVGMARHFHLLQDGEEEVLVAMAVSSFNNTCQQTNSTILQVTASGIQVYQTLGEGAYFTEDNYAGSSLLLHGLQYTLAYTLDVATHRWNLEATLPVHAGGVVVHHLYGVIHLLQDYTNATTYVRRAVPARSRGGLKLLFALFSTVTSCQGPAHSLKVFRVVDGSHHCVAEAALPTYPADLTVFFAGSNAAGSHLAVVTLYSHEFPIIFSFSGEVLSRWGEVEAATTATWVQHALVRRHGRHFPDYYILLSPLQHLPEPHPITYTTAYPDNTPNIYSSHPTTPKPYDPYTPPSSTSKPYNPYTPPPTTSKPYNPYTPPPTTSKPYNPYTPPSTTSNPYNPYTSPHTTPNPYTPLSSTPNPYNRYTPPSTTPNPYNPYTPPSTTPNPYTSHYTTPNPYNSYPASDDRYVRSIYDSTKPGVSVIYRLVMRGSAVAAANITCTRY